MKERGIRLLVLTMLLLLLCSCGLQPSHDGQAKIPSESMRGKNYQDVEELFRQHGFTNIQTEKIEDLILGWLTKDGEVKEVSIAGEVNYATDTWVPADTKVVIRYHTFLSSDEKAHDSKTETPPQTESKSNETKPESSSPSTQTRDNSVSYSTNDKKTAKSGNSGVYSYRSNSGSYYTYYIIDFDEGFVYRFCDGNGDTLCDRVKIVSGDLNSCLIITYHDGGDSWSYGLHFKWKNQPDHLIVEDEDGFEWDFSTTSLSDALSIKRSKTICDY